MYRTELNQRIKGSSIIFLPNLYRANKTYGTTEHTIAMCTKLLLNDIQIFNHYVDEKTIETIWDAQATYGVEDAELNVYYKQNKIVADNPNVVVTYYDCPNGKTLSIVGNISKEDQTAIIDFSGLNKTLPGTINEELLKENITVENNHVKLKIPARHFRMLGF